MVDVTVKREGDDVVLTVGGKKRNLDDVDDSKFDSKAAAKDEAELVADGEAFSLSDSDDADEPEQQHRVPPVSTDQCPLITVYGLYS